MPKSGLLHDYDLMANRERASQSVKCAVCDTENTRFQWSDYHGEAMCCQCGCTYQLKGGSKEEEEKNAYPYMTMADKWVPIAREYWRTFHKFVHYGQSFSHDEGLREFTDWCKTNHPEVIKKETA